MRLSLLVVALGLLPLTAAAGPPVCVQSGVPADHPRQPACRPAPTEDGPFTLDPVPARCDRYAIRYSVWPLSAEAVLVARAVDWDAMLPGEPDGTLVEVDCKSGEGRPFLPRRKGVDFGTGALSRDGKTLFYTGARGVERLDLRTRRVTRLTRNGVVGCSAATDVEEFAYDPAQIRDVVLGFAEGERRLRIRRQWGCPTPSHAYGDRDEYDLVRPFSRKPRLLSPTPVVALAAGVGGTLWAAVGAYCDSDCEGPYVWRSLGGGPWARVAVPTEVAPTQIVADARRPGHVVALGSTRQDDLADSTGGELIRTTDDGQTWAAIPPPSDGPCDALEVVDGDVDHLRVLCSGPFETRDAGQRWVPFAGEVTTHRQTTLLHGGQRYRATRDGLWRRTPGRMDDLERLDPR